MRILLNHYHHYTQVVFPMLAQEYNWTIKFDTQFKAVINRILGIRPEYANPGMPNNFQLTRKELKKAVALCKDITHHPEKMHHYV